MSNSSLPDSSLPEALADLQPSLVWRYFHELTQIPRGSGNEEGVRAYLENFAKEKNISFEQDEIGNVLLRVRPDAAGKTVCLQGHMDMVCVAAEGVEHDFAKDPIKVRKVDDKIYGSDTTLGADNGIGLAYGLALIEEETGPLEILCTVDEEVGLVGASQLKTKWLKSDYLINLDSEEEDYLTVACSGGRDLVLYMGWDRAEPQADFQAVELKVGGLQGGHSGIDIGLGRTNAIKVMGGLLDVVRMMGGQLLKISGGVKRNAIPPVASATVAIPKDKLEELQQATQAVTKDFMSLADTELKVEANVTESDLKPVTEQAMERLIHLIGQLPHGVQKFTSTKLPYVSNNLALINELDDGRLQVIMSGRSPSGSELDELETRVQGIASEHQAEYACENSYPGWEPNYDSQLLATTKEVYAEVFGKEPEVLEIHAGLECGIIGSKYPELDMISIGPDIHFPHSPREHVSIPSVERMYGLVVSLVKKLQS